MEARDIPESSIHLFFFIWRRECVSVFTHVFKGQVNCRHADEPDKVRDTVTLSPQSDFVFSAACTQPSWMRPDLSPCVLSAVWYTHACEIHTALGLITWHTCMTSSACNQIHMSPSLLLLLSESISGILSLFLSTRDFVFMLLFVRLLILLFSPHLPSFSPFFVHHLGFLFVCLFFSCLCRLSDLMPGPQHESHC